MTTGAKKEASVVEGSTDISKAVAALKSRYCQWLDGQQWDRWPSLFNEDATLQVGPNAASAVHGRRAIRQLLKAQLRGAKTLHQVHDPEMPEVGPAEVRVVWRMSHRVSTPLYLLEGAGHSVPLPVGERDSCSALFALPDVRDVPRGYQEEACGCVEADEPGLDY